MKTNPELSIPINTVHKAKQLHGYIWLQIQIAAAVVFPYKVFSSDLLRNLIKNKGQTSCMPRAGIIFTPNTYSTGISPVFCSAQHSALLASKQSTRAPGTPGVDRVTLKDIWEKTELIAATQVWGLSTRNAFTKAECWHIQYYLH